MVTAHAVLLRGPAFTGGGRAPSILQRTDGDFVSAVLAGLATEAGRAALRGSIAATRTQGVLRLFQPVHRTFHLAVVDAVCPTLGMPRLDPRKIDSAGLVLRRLGADPGGGAYEEAWVRGAAGALGWVRLSAGARREDPDPARRRQPSTGLAALDQRLARGAGAGLAEATSSLFAAPPDTCAAAGQTLLYGLVPTASTEAAEGAEAFTYLDEEVRQHLPVYLRAHASPVPVPRPGALLTAADADDPALADYIGFVKQLLIELDMSGAGALSERLRALLAGVALSYPDDVTGNARDHLAAAVTVLVNRAGGAVRMPLRWPALDAAAEAAFVGAARAVLEARFAELAPRRGRFDTAGARYVLTAFVRVKRDDGCPPELFWSEPTEPFTIAPWYENGPVPPHPIQLPPISRESVKALKPNVAFQVPSSLFNFLARNDPKKLLEGKGVEGPASPALEWICGFNIPIITLCAFIVLSIFLTLLHIVFWWLPFIRICLPIPSSWRRNA
ncbi:hypothetical protein ACMHYB_58765 [Sorangium sp. So ce1128]